MCHCVYYHYRIDVSFVIKVADFGLAESMDSSKDYFRQNEESIIKLPIKWLALESIHDGVFSEKSDVVSDCTPTLILHQNVCYNSMLISCSQLATL